MTQCWNLYAVADRYRRFIARHERLETALGRSSLEPRQAFLVQTLMIHAYRRATLHDPQLPAVMLPTDWPGTVAFELCRTLYTRTVDAAQQHLARTLSATTEAIATRTGRPAALEQRFGGLRR